MKLLNKEQVAERLGVKPRTAATMMLQMNPVVISGTVRKQYRVTEENLERWMMKRMTGRIPTGKVGTNKKRLERR